MFSFRLLRGLFALAGCTFKIVVCVSHCDTVRACAHFTALASASFFRGEMCKRVAGLGTSVVVWDVAAAASKSSPRDHQMVRSAIPCR